MSVLAKPVLKKESKSLNYYNELNKNNSNIKIKKQKHKKSLSLPEFPSLNDDNLTTNKQKKKNRIFYSKRESISYTPKQSPKIMELNNDNNIINNNNNDEYTIIYDMDQSDNEYITHEPEYEYDFDSDNDNDIYKDITMHLQLSPQTSLKYITPIPLITMPSLPENGDSEYEEIEMYLAKKSPFSYMSSIGMTPKCRFSFNNNNNNIHSKHNNSKYNNNNGLTIFDPWVSEENGLDIDD